MTKLKTCALALLLLTLSVVPARATDKVAVFLNATAGATTSATYVFKLRSAFAASPLYTLVLKESDAMFVVNIVAIDDGTYATAAAISLTIENNDGYNWLVDQWVIYTGSSHIPESVDNLIAGIDGSVQKLRAWAAATPPTKRGE